MIPHTYSVLLKRSVYKKGRQRVFFLSPHKLNFGLAKLIYGFFFERNQKEEKISHITLFKPLVIRGIFIKVNFSIAQSHFTFGFKINTPTKFRVKFSAFFVCIKRSVSTCVGVDFFIVGKRMSDY